MVLIHLIVVASHHRSVNTFVQLWSGSSWVEVLYSGTRNRIMQLCVYVIFLLDCF